MKLLLSSLLLSSLCALSSWSVPSDTQAVAQTPDVSIVEGETFNITCCWRVEFERLTVQWLKNQTQVKSEVLVKMDFEGPQWKETPDCAHLTLANITREDSGRYTCRVTVDIPLHRQFEGNGTVVTVKSRDNPKDKTSGDESPGVPDRDLPIPVIVSAAVVAALLLVTLACFCNMRRRQAQAARVIYEVPHSDSEVADMDKHSTSSSRGSSQWCQVPVYESFDYFERVQTKESG